MYAKCRYIFTEQLFTHPKKIFQLFQCVKISSFQSKLHGDYYTNYDQ